MRAYRKGNRVVLSMTPGEANRLADVLADPVLDGLADDARNLRQYGEIEASKKYLSARATLMGIYGSLLVVL